MGAASPAASDVGKITSPKASLQAIGQPEESVSSPSAGLGSSGNYNY